MIQSERILHQEVMLRLRALKPNCVVIPIPNSIYFPARSPAERAIIARVIAQMKNEGSLLPGAFDFAVLWESGSGVIDLKRPAEQTLFGKRPGGRPSPAQREFEALCDVHGVPHRYATSWDEVHSTLADWGRVG